MEIHVAKGSLSSSGFDAIIIPYFEDDNEVSRETSLIDEKIEKSIHEVITAGDFTGQLYEHAVVYPINSMPSKRIILIGLGKHHDLDLDKLRGAFSKAAQQVRRLKKKRFAVSITMIPSKFPVNKAIESVAEGIFLGLYRFEHFKTLDRKEDNTPENFTIICDDDETFKSASEAVKSAEKISRAVCFVRDIVNMPGNVMTPACLAHEAKKIAKKKKVTATVLDADQMAGLGMNALLGVSRGSDEPPKFIILEYRGGKKTEPFSILVGKGITFDSGGISLKAAEKMSEMKNDMAGGAAVLGVIMAVSDLNLPFNIAALVPAAENLSGGKALKPGDIVKSFSGRTIEVINTDAEGRLIMADALTYAGKFKPDFIIDMATLTGGCVVALGAHVIGMMGTDNDLKEKIREAGFATGEKVWELPLWKEYDDLIKSDVADFKNSGTREASSIAAAMFLSKFAGQYPWVHLDIAGPAWYERDKPYVPKGASGIGVRLLVEFFRNRH